MVTHNILTEILGVLTILGFLLVAFSKAKSEDESLSRIRLVSLVWSVLLNYGILLVSF
jgi:hypothetical protein